MRLLICTLSIALLSLLVSCSRTGRLPSPSSPADSSSKLAQAKTLTHKAEQAYEAKNIDRMIHFYQEAINLCLADIAARATGDLEPAEVEELLHTAKAAAFNLGSNTWPGWDQPGIKLSARHLESGRQAAQHNLQLAQRLRRGPDKLAIAHWLIGAHAMAADALDKAKLSFELAKQFGAKSGSADLVNLAQGYLSLTKRLQGDPAAQRSLDETIQHFDASASTNASAASYAGQLRTASAVFSSQR